MIWLPVLQIISHCTTEEAKHHSPLERPLKPWLLYLKSYYQVMLCIQMFWLLQIIQLKRVIDSPSDSWSSSQTGLDTVGPIPECLDPVWTLGVLECISSLGLKGNNLYTSLCTAPQCMSMYRIMQTHPFNLHSMVECHWPYPWFTSYSDSFGPY